MATPRILTFNFHEPYLCLMAEAGLDLVVGLYEKPPLARTWATGFRPVPRNVRFLEESQWKYELAAGKFDVVIAHNEMNAATVAGYDVGKILVCHNRRSFLKASIPEDDEANREAFDLSLKRLSEYFGFVYISESKRADYDYAGPVILPGINVDAYGGYRGDVAQVLRVGNSMRARNRMFDVDFQEEVIAGFPNRLVGQDPDIPEATPSNSFEDLLDTFRSLRCMLHVTREDWEDGYNLAMLEAMACGMPVVSLANRTSPLTDGEDGFVSYEASVLRERIGQLLDDPDLAFRIGERGRQTVAEKFSMAAFAKNWREVVEEAAAKAKESTERIAPSLEQAPSEDLVVPRVNLLLEYITSPMTTGKYFEAAARTLHEVVTAGFRCPHDVLKLWGYGDDIPPYDPLDVDLPLYFTQEELASRLPEGFEPQLLLHIDSSRQQISHNVEDWKIPTACYLIDTHLEPGIRIDIARRFDYTFLAQKAQVADFRKAGVKNVMWLPLACAPELHDLESQERGYDVSYVGRFGDDPTDRRRELLMAVKERFSNNHIGQCWPAEMACVYAQSKIVVNVCINHDVNMRVFEAMASGALLITDQAVGLEELFEDGKHFVVYRKDEDLFGLIEKYLADEEARARIADAGRAFVLAEHSYAQRLQKIVATVTAHTQAQESLVDDDRFTTGGYYGSERPELTQLVPSWAKRVLDVGCGVGMIGKGLKDKGIDEVVGIEIVEQACELASQVLDRAVLGNIEEMDLPFDDGYFDCIICGDVLEHLVDPGRALRKLGRILAHDGIIIASIPNIQYYEVIRMLTDGRWHYDDAGILDRTHLRFFTGLELRELVKDIGLDLLRLRPLSMEDPANLPRNPDGSLTIGRITIGPPLTKKEYYQFLTYQYLVIIGRLGGDRLMQARVALAEDRNEAAYLFAKEAQGVDEGGRKLIMAQACAHMGNLSEASELYGKVVELFPNEVLLAGEYGVVLAEMGDFETAAPLLEKALKIAPGNHALLSAIGHAHAAADRPEEALRYFEEALSDYRGDEGLLVGLMDVARQLGRLEEAEGPLAQFVDFYPGHISMALRLAQLLVELGRPDEARERLDTILLLAPGEEGARALLEDLNKDHPQD